MQGTVCNGIYSPVAAVITSVSAKSGSNMRPAGARTRPREQQTRTRSLFARTWPSLREPGARLRRDPWPLSAAHSDTTPPRLKVAAAAAARKTVPSLLAVRAGVSDLSPILCPLLARACPSLSSARIVCACIGCAPSAPGTLAAARPTDTGRVRRTHKPHREYAQVLSLAMEGARRNHEARPAATAGRFARCSRTTLSVRAGARAPCGSAAFMPGSRHGATAATDTAARSRLPSSSASPSKRATVSTERQPQQPQSRQQAQSGRRTPRLIEYSLRVWKQPQSRQRQGPRLQAHSTSTRSGRQHAAARYAANIFVQVIAQIPPTGGCGYPKNRRRPT